MRSRASRTIIPIGRYRDHEMKPAATRKLIAERPEGQNPGEAVLPPRSAETSPLMADESA